MNAIPQASMQILSSRLAQEGIINTATADKACKIQAQQPNRNISDILIQDLGINHDTLFRGIAKLYSFREYVLDVEEVDEAFLKNIKTCLESLPEEIRQKALDKRVIPVEATPNKKSRLKVIVPDLIDRRTVELPSRFGYKQSEIYYCPLTTIDGRGIARVLV